MRYKYELTDKTRSIGPVTVKQIKRISDGVLGGFIEKESNLSHGGDCWVLKDAVISGNARVSENAHIYGNAQVSEYALVCGNAKISGNARIFGSAWVCGYATVYETTWVFGSAWVGENSHVFGDAQISGTARIYGDAQVSGHAQVHGTARVFGTTKVGENAILDDSFPKFFENLPFDFSVLPKEVTEVKVNGIIYYKKPTTILEKKL